MCWTELPLRRQLFQTDDLSSEGGEKFVKKRSECAIQIETELGAFELILHGNKVSKQLCTRTNVEIESKIAVRRGKCNRKLNQTGTLFIFLQNYAKKR